MEAPTRREDTGPAPSLELWGERGGLYPVCLPDFWHGGQKEAFLKVEKGSGRKMTVHVDMYCR